MKGLKILSIPAILALTFIACGEDETPSGPTPKPQSPWKVVFSFDDPKGQWIEDLWFSGPKDGWACSYQHVFNYDGNRWRVFADMGKELNAIGLTDICAPAPNDVWVGGPAIYPEHLYHYDGKRWEPVNVAGEEYVEGLEDIFFLGPDQGWASFQGDELIPGMLFRYDGIKWHSYPGSVLFEELYFVTANNGWAYGYEYDTFKRQFYHYDGNYWEEVNLPGPPAKYFEAIKFNGPNDGWLLGKIDTNPILYHYDGIKWAVVECPPNAEYARDADFVSATNGWLAGEKSWYYDGEKFALTLGLTITSGNLNSGLAARTTYGPQRGDSTPPIIYYTSRGLSKERSRRRRRGRPGSSKASGVAGVTGPSAQFAV